MRARTVALLPLLAVAAKTDLEACPGDFRWDHRCHHPAAQVCTQLLEPDGSPLQIANGQDWWQLTGQVETRWDAEMRAAHGDHWCTCVLCTSEIISKAGCDSLHIKCNATDIFDIMMIAEDDPSLKPLEKCLLSKCPAATTPPPLYPTLPEQHQLNDASHVRLPIAEFLQDRAPLIGASGLLVAACILGVHSRRRVTTARSSPLSYECADVELEAEAYD
eukprot:gnl/TRDRNA2_/TRDRNA2_92149_c0_seq1.p1 gnl/TRDRNA2_/TRDRNA2_92149_c0~~gnl/TRDRNA2_/TRDRNA2_92149_c0_seq1.p1  ORF type:complete len:219 (+),score=32.45 gnl/TRDRNA2_/TRDRNA2_92149_c0_seq1:73-729(+)